MESRQRVRGVVISFDASRGFGFIDSIAGKVFLHRKALGSIRVEPGDTLEFEIYRAGQGFAAERIHRLIESTALSS